MLKDFLRVGQSEAGDLYAMPSELPTSLSSFPIVCPQSFLHHCSSGFVETQDFHGFFGTFTCFTTLSWSANERKSC